MRELSDRSDEELIAELVMRHPIVDAPESTVNRKNYRLVRVKTSHTTTAEVTLDQQAYRAILASGYLDADR